MSQKSQENTWAFYEISKNIFSCRTPLVAAAVDLKTILVFLECIKPLKLLACRCYSSEQGEIFDDW